MRAFAVRAYVFEAPFTHTILKPENFRVQGLGLPVTCELAERLDHGKRTTCATFFPFPSETFENYSLLNPT